MGRVHGGVIFEEAFAELGYTQRNMKILLAIALFGAVQATPEAEADPALLYGGYYGHGLGYYGGYGGYYGHAGAVQAGAPYANGWTDGPNNGVGPHLLGKREAEAEPEAEADAAAYYGGYYGYGGLGYYGGYGGYYGLIGYYAQQVGAPYANGWTD